MPFTLMRDDARSPRRPPALRAPSAATTREILRRLEDRLGPLEPPPAREPLEELVLTVLSQNTSDVNRDRAFQSLRARYPTWEEVAAAPAGELAASIKVGGLSNVKAPRLLSMLREIKDREGGRLDLSWMRKASAASVREYLRTLPGVGPKTAACVLAFSLGHPTVPVDTHVFRVARRLGFLDERANAEKAHAIMDELVRPGMRVRTHVGMIRLGRTICRAGRPSCEVCPLQDLCPTAPAFLGKPKTEPKAAATEPKAAATRRASRAGVRRR